MHGLFVFVRVENTSYYEGGDYMNKFQVLGLVLVICAVTAALIGSAVGGRK